MSAQQFPAEICTENNTLLDHKMDKGKKRLTGLHTLYQEQSQKTSWNLQELRDILCRTSYFHFIVFGFQIVNLQ